MDDNKNNNISFREARSEDVHQMVSINLKTWKSAYGDFMSDELLDRRAKDRLIMEKNI